MAISEKNSERFIKIQIYSENFGKIQKKSEYVRKNWKKSEKIRKNSGKSEKKSSREFHERMNNNRAGPNNQAGRIYFGKLISEQALITMSRVDFFKFINKRACSVIREVRVIYWGTFP